MIHELLEELLGASRSMPELASLAELRARAAALVQRATSRVERAVLGGFAADRVGYAFAAGYGEALGALVPEVGDRRLALAVTEEGGAHPRAIATRLERKGDGFALTGKKRWTTLGLEAEVLLVAASLGVDAAGRNQLRLVRVDASAPGVHRVAMPDPPFAPEIRHAELRLEAVSVRDEDLLEGDGYERYVKPFRTIEDVHVLAAVLGYLVGVGRDRGWPHALEEDLLAHVVALTALAGADPSSRALHVALGGVLRGVAHTVSACDEAWGAGADDEALARWRRDRPLLEVAGRAREARLASAWNALGK